jgi:hypothetical protein
VLLWATSCRNYFHTGKLIPNCFATSSAGAASLGARSRSCMRIYLRSWAPKPLSFSFHSGMNDPNLHRCAGNLGKIAVLLGCHEDFTLAVLRAVRDHMSKNVGATQTCGVDGCIHHPQQWSQSDIEDSNRPPSEAGFSDFTEIVISTQPNTITKDDEDAMEAAEVLEALSEIYHSGWNPANVTE